MGALAEVLQNLASQELARTAQEFNQDTAKKYYNILSALQEKIQKALNEDDQDLTFKASIGQQLQALQIRSHLSIKGGADIVEPPIDQNIFQDSELALNFLRRRQTKNFIKYQKIIQLTSEAMNIVYSLRQDLTQSLEERLTLTYNGITKNASALKAIIIPMNILLVELNHFFINMSKDSSNGEMALTLSTSENFINILQNIKGAQEITLTDNIVKDYFDNINILRTDNKYSVVEEDNPLTQSGFVAEALTRLFFQIINQYEYSQDNADWFTHSDNALQIDENKLGLSNKNIAPNKEGGKRSNPTLLRLNGFINNTLTELTNILNQKDFNSIQSKLSTFFKITSEANQIESVSMEDVQDWAQNELQI